MHTHAYLAAWNGVNELRNRLNETPSEISTYSRRFIFLESLSLSGALSVTSSLDLQTDRGMQHVKNASTQDKLSSVVIIHSGPPSRSRQARTFGLGARARARRGVCTARSNARLPGQTINNHTSANGY